MTLSGTRTLLVMKRFGRAGRGARAPGVAGDRDPEPLLEDLAAQGRVQGAADVRPVGRDRDEPDEGAAGEDRGRHGDVLEVAGPDPRVVGDHEVALAPVLRGVLGEERVEGPRQGADERRARDGRFGERPPLAVEHHHREVLRLADGDGVGGADHGRGGLVHDREEPAPHDLDVARRESVRLRRLVRTRLRLLPHRRPLLRLRPRPRPRGRRHRRSASRTIRRFACSSSPKRAPGGTTVVVCRSTTRAGPGKRSSGASPSRR